MQIVRKKLTPTEVSNPNLRYNPICDCVQLTPDGGATWYDMPSLDPRTSTSLQFPARGGDDPRCDAAANMLEKLQAIVTQFTSGLEQLSMVNTLIAIIVPFMPEVALILEIIEAMAAAALAIGASIIASAFTSDQWDLILCILNGNVSSTGVMTSSQLTNVLIQIHDQCDSIVYDVMYFVLPSLGNVGLTNAGASGDVVGDCSACGWCHQFDFLTSDEGFSQEFFGEYATGWQSTVVIGDGDMAYRGCEIYKIFGFDVHLTSIEIDLDVVCGVNNAGTGWILASSTPWNGTGLIQNSTCETGDAQTLVHSETLTISGLTFIYTVGTAGNGNHADPGGQVTIKRIVLRGSGDNPFGDDNCS